MNDVLVKYCGEDTYIPLRCRWSSKEEKNSREFYELNIADEVTREIVKTAGDNYRIDHGNLGYDVQFELRVDETPYGTYISHPDGSYTHVVAEDHKVNWKFKPDADPVVTGDFFYDITDGGYINANTLLNDGAQIKKVIDAIDTLISFRKALTKAGLLESM